MSRIGKRPIVLHSEVNVKIENNRVLVKGPKGQMHYDLSTQIQIDESKNQLILHTKETSKEAKAIHGLSRTIISNMITGVSQGFRKNLKINGVGYKAQVDSQQNLILNVGYSHPVQMTPPTGIRIKVSNNTEISIEGIDKEAVGQFAAEIRSKRSPEPYKGKGIRYSNEVIRRKAGKAGK